MKIPATQHQASNLVVSCALQRVCCVLAVITLGVGAATADQAPPMLALRAADGAQVALWRASPNPNKPYIA